MKGEGPVGAEGVVLTPGRSLAVDRAFLPLGVPLWLDLADPQAPDGRLRRLVVAQDTGGAIRGPVRGDLFWGYGADAAARAGMMKDRGAYYLLLPRNVAVRRGATS
jgi:membrane-bound lytic murein transglycosylase A